MLLWKSPPFKKTWDLRLWDRHRGWWKIINTNKDNTFQLHVVFYSLAAWCSTGTNGKTGCNTVPTTESWNSKLFWRVITECWWVFSHTKRKIAMVPAPAKSILATSPGKPCARTFFFFLNAFVESNCSWKTKVKSNLSFPKCNSLTHYWKKCLCCRFLLKG